MPAAVDACIDLTASDSSDCSDLDLTDSDSSGDSSPAAAASPPPAKRAKTASKAPGIKQKSVSTGTVAASGSAIDLTASPAATSTTSDDGFPVLNVNRAATDRLFEENCEDCGNKSRNVGLP